VLLISENDHDGREGAAAFVKVAARLKAAVPVQSTLAEPLSEEAVRVVAERARRADAIVLWSSATVASRVLNAVQEARAPVYLCRKAMEAPAFNILRTMPNIRFAQCSGLGNHRTFSERFTARTGASPSPAAAGVYDAVRIIARGLRQAGPNRARLRDALASRPAYHGASGIISFDGAGNNQTEVTVAALP
jgi:ABC-type branched-subunit amino acid transport system substrate-binding protein